jgi:hypothetical protein
MSTSAASQPVKPSVRSVSNGICCATLSRVPYKRLQPELLYASTRALLLIPPTSACGTLAVPFSPSTRYLLSARFFLLQIYHRCVCFVGKKRNQCSHHELWVWCEHLQSAMIDTDFHLLSCITQVSITRQLLHDNLDYSTFHTFLSYKIFGRRA